MTHCQHYCGTTEHCIVAYKKPLHPQTSPSCIDTSLIWAHRGIDTDVIVSEVRETSRKPDEIYSLIERLSPGLQTRRLELFGRKHNTRSGWLTVGNQLGDSCVYEEDVVRRLNQRWERAPSFIDSIVVTNRMIAGILKHPLSSRNFLQIIGLSLNGQIPFSHISLSLAFNHSAIISLCRVR